MSQIVYVSPCPNCVRGVCKIKKHHQLLYHRHQFVPILESASTSGSSTPNRLQMLENGHNSCKALTTGTMAAHSASAKNQKGQSKTADCSADDESSEDDDSRIIKESPSRYSLHTFVEYVMIVTRLFVDWSEVGVLIRLLVRSFQSVDGWVRGLHLQSWRVEEGGPLRLAVWNNF